MLEEIWIKKTIYDVSRLDRHVGRNLVSRWGFVFFDSSRVSTAITLLQSKGKIREGNLAIRRGKAHTCDYGSAPRMLLITIEWIRITLSPVARVDEAQGPRCTLASSMMSECLEPQIVEELESSKR
jgi:hypothetical protein